MGVTKIVFLKHLKHLKNAGIKMQKKNPDVAKISNIFELKIF